MMEVGKKSFYYFVPGLPLEVLMAPDQEIPLFRRAVAAKTTRIMDLRCKNKKNMDFPSLFILLLGNVSMLIIRADF